MNLPFHQYPDNTLLKSVITPNKLYSPLKTMSRFWGEKAPTALYNIIKNSPFSSTPNQVSPLLLDGYLSRFYHPCLDNTYGFLFVGRDASYLPSFTTPSLLGTVSQMRLEDILTWYHNYSSARSAPFGSSPGPMEVFIVPFYYHPWLPYGDDAYKGDLYWKFTQFSKELYTAPRPPGEPYNPPILKRKGTLIIPEERALRALYGPFGPGRARRAHSGCYAPWFTYSYKHLETVTIVLFPNNYINDFTVYNQWALAPRKVLTISNLEEMPAGVSRSLTGRSVLGSRYEIYINRRSSKLGIPVRPRRSNRVIEEKECVQNKFDFVPGSAPRSIGP